METKQRVRTDLAVEAREMLTEKEQQTAKQSGIEEKNEIINGVRVNRIQLNKEAASEIGKKPGTYVTVYADAVNKRDADNIVKQTEVVIELLKDMLKQQKVLTKDKGLIVGLGNSNITPDALGPATVNRIIVTNHLFTLGQMSDTDEYRPVAAISPGVMGVTGLETSDIVKSIITSYEPQFIIVIDALASRSTERINETIQMTDTGIHPGSGVGNHRKEISKTTVGVPVIAIGVPTVVDAVTIVSDTFEAMEQYFGKEWREKNRLKNNLVPASMRHRHQQYSDEDFLEADKKQAFLGLIGTLSTDEKRNLLEDILAPIGKNMIVTPKEVDHFIEDMAELLANAINGSLHEGVAIE